MKAMIKFVPNPVKRSPEQSQRILSFLKAVRSVQPIRPSLLKALAERLAFDPDSLTALILVYGGEVQEDGK